MTDEQLIQVVAAQGPDAAAAFDALAARWHPFLVNWFRKLGRRGGDDADNKALEQANQWATDTLMLARLKAGYFHPSRGSFRQWVCSLGFRVRKVALRKKATAPFVQWPELDEDEDFGPPAPEGPAATVLEWLARTRAAFEALPPPLRETMLMLYFDSLTPEKTAARLGVHRKSVQNWAAKAHKLLSKAIEPPEEDVSGVSLDRRREPRG